MPGKLFVISAPSGTGKTTVIQAVRRLLPNLQFSVTHTTRAPRAGEQDGREYHFVSRAAFEGMIADDAFVEWVELFGNYYGTARAPIEAWQQQGLDVLLDIEIQGAEAIKAWQREAVLIFLEPPSFEVLAARLAGRGTEDQAVVAERLDRARVELAARDVYDYQVVNDAVDRAAQEIVSVMQQEVPRAAP